MALTTTKQYIYPNNWDEFYEDYQVGHKRYRVILTGVGTATENETNVHKLILESYKTPGGDAASRFRVDKVECISLVGFTLLTLNFDRVPIGRIAAFGDYTNGFLDFTKNGKYDGLIDGGTGGTGDITFTTEGGSVNDSYTIVIEFRVK